MKKSLIILPTAFLTLLSSVNANAATGKVHATEVDTSKTKTTPATHYYLAEESVIFDPGNYFMVPYAEAAEAVIVADQQITESGDVNEGLPFFKAKSIDEVIAADIAITEATLVDAVPLHIVEVIAPAVLTTKAPNAKL